MKGCVRCDVGETQRTELELRLELTARCPPGHPSPKRTDTIITHILRNALIQFRMSAAVSLPQPTVIHLASSPPSESSFLTPTRAFSSEAGLANSCPVSMAERHGDSWRVSGKGEEGGGGGEKEEEGTQKGQ